MPSRSFRISFGAVVGRGGRDGAAALAPSSSTVGVVGIDEEAAKIVFNITLVTSRDLSTL